MGKIFNSQDYLGQGKNDYFEGWYFRHLGNHPFSLIVGVSKCKSDPHSFIQFIDSFKSAYFRYGVDEFGFSKENMTITLGGNIFSTDGIKIKLLNASLSVVADIKYSDADFFKKSVYVPSVMGPFSYFPLPCNHAVISMSHTARGSLIVDGAECRFEGLGYIEKDFGKKFPQKYFWMHAAGEGISIMTAVANPAFLNVRGHLCVISYGGLQHNLSLYRLGKIKKLRQTSDSVEFCIGLGDTELNYSINSNDSFKSLLAPDKNGNMTIEIKENLAASFDGRLKLKGAEIDLSAIKTCAFESVM